MPELPEVQTVINELNPLIMYQKIMEIEEVRKGTIISNLKLILPQKVISINRRGKYIIINLEQNQIVIHLRMTGKLIQQPELFITKHTRAYFKYENGTSLIFDDIRTFGKIWILKVNEKLDAIEKLGVEPLSKEFDSIYLKEILQRRKAPVKNLLLDQRVVAGLGNIYVCEILYRAKIHPDSKGNELSERSLNKIVEQTKIVLTQAIKNNGTTISDYRRVDDKTGEFQNFLKVYQKKICECGETITRKKHAGRSTFFCNKCQKLEIKI